MRKVGLGLFGNIMLAMAAGIAVGFVLPEWGVRTLKTFEVFVTVLLKFLVPLVILGLVTAAIVEAGKNSGRMLVATFAFVIVSVIVSGYFALGSSVVTYPCVLPERFADDFAALAAAEPYFKIAIPPPLDIMTTLALAVIGGLAIVFTRSETLAAVALDGKRCVAWMIGKIIIPVLPWYIFAMMAGMTAGGKIVSLLVVFLCMILVSWAVSVAYLVLMYCVVGAYARKNPLKALWGMRSAYLTAFATCSSAASIPVSLENVKGLGVREEVAELVVPLCATIHLAGSMIKLVCCSAAFILLSGRPVEFGAMSMFIFVMTVTAIAAPGVPGGVITSSLGALASILFLTPEQCSMLMTVYLAMDGVGSACSVGGHGAIALAVDKASARTGHDLPSPCRETSTGGLSAFVEG